MINHMFCKQCKSDNCILENSQDSYYRNVRCLACGWWCWLLNYNK